MGLKEEVDVWPELDPLPGGHGEEPVVIQN